MSADRYCDYCHLPVPRPRRPATAQPDGEPVYCCYGCRFAAQVAGAHGQHAQATWMLTRLGVAAFLSMAVMAFSLYLYGQQVYEPRAPETSPLAASLTGLMRYLCLLFATPVFFLLGLPILDNAWRQFRNGIVSTDALVVLGVAAAFVYSYVSTLSDRDHTYYETACMILVLVTLGRWLEAAGKLKASAAVEALEALIPSEVSVERDGLEQTVPSEEVRAGDLLHVAAGQRIAADGLVERGRANVDEQIVTGESTPVQMGVGDTVRAGTVNLDGVLTVRATAVGADSTLGRLARLLEQAKRSKGRYERLADRVAAVFVPVTVALAIVAAGLGLRRGGIDEAIMSALAVMLIACPCALGIATPMAVWVSLGRAAAGGVLFRNGEVIEVLARVRAAFLDKSGTLTTGQPKVASFRSRSDGQAQSDRALAVAAGLGETTTHPLSRSVVAYADDHGISPAAVTDVVTIPGRGVVGTVNGDQAALGNVALMRDQGLTVDEALDRQMAGAAGQGQGIACVGLDGAVAGVFAFSESIRPEAREAIEALKRRGCRVTVLTGDHHRRGQALAEALAVTTVAELLPEDKVGHLEQARHRYGPVAMIGDGLNDAPALVAADVGIAMGCGADVTRESAGVCLLGNDLSALPWIFELARRTVGTIRQNLFWACVYNVAGISLAMTGLLSPVFAAGAMVVSSLLVVGNSLRLARGTREAFG